MSFLSSDSSSLEGITGLLFWATAGGFLVLVGLVLEKFSQWLDDRYDAPPEKPHKYLESIGWWILMLGIAIEVADAGIAAINEWENRPLNRPIATVSAISFLTIKIEHPILNPASDNNWRSGVSFFQGTNLNESNQIFDLEADKNDVEFGQILGFKSCTNCGLFTIKLHQMPPYPGFPTDKGIGMPAKTFDDVGCLVFSMPQVSSNSEVMAGKVIVTVNSSLTWEFEIPPQKQRFELITAKKIKTGKNSFKTEILPVPIVDNASSPRLTNFFDGK